MAHRGGPTEQCRSEGTPSLGEVPSGGAQRFWLLFWRLKKVTRCKSGTLSGRYRSNGYVLDQQIQATCQAAFASKPAPTGELG